MLIVLWSWILINTVGLVVTGYLVLASIEDRRYIKKLGINGDLEIMTKGAIINDVLRFCTMVLLNASGVVALIIGVVQATPQDSNVGRYFVRFILLLAATLLTTDGIIALRIRRALRRRTRT